jgi:DNA-directed RNA polymerase specialized sigma24 family protein
MTPENSTPYICGGLDTLSVSDLVERCRDESTRYRRNCSGERGYCYELFRRAIVEHNEEAWKAVYEQYRRLVGKWVGPPVDLIDERVNRAFAKFWHAMDPEVFTEKFATIGKVLAYLRLCARSVRIDDRRAQEKQQLLNGVETIAIRTPDTTARQAMNCVTRQELFAYIEQRLKDKQEKLVVYFSFKIGLAPRHIAQECSDVFDDVAEVRRVKERVVRRLSNDLWLDEWWNSQT